MRYRARFKAVHWNNQIASADWMDLDQALEIGRGWAADGETAVEIESEDGRVKKLADYPAKNG